MKNKYSELSADGLSLRIDRQATPFNWDNYLYNRRGDFYSIVGQNGAGRLCYNFERNIVARGRNFLVKSEDGSIWSITGGAAPCKAEKSQVIQSPGKSEFSAEYQGIAGKLSVAVDPDEYVEANLLELENKSDKAQTIVLTVCSFVRLEGVDNSQQLDQTFYDESNGLFTLRRYHSESARNRYSAFFAADKKADSWCGSEEDFVGANVPFHEALALYSENLPAVHAYSSLPMFALRYKLTLQAGEKVSMQFILGITDTIEEAYEQGLIYQESGKAEAIIARAEEFHRERLNCGMISTPCETLNAAYNTWTKLQLLNQNQSKRLGTMHNWRNNLQDASGALIFYPHFARENLIELAKLTLKDGFVPRSTPKNAGAVGAIAAEQMKQRHNDIGCWYALGAADYVLETGDFSVLGEKVFNPARNREITVAEAVAGGLIWAYSQRGMNGLVRFMDGDWSDPLEKAGRRGIGESVWTSFAVIYATNRFAPVLRVFGEEKLAERLEKCAVEVAESLKKNAWDGKWFVRGITDDGVKFCCESDKDAQISMLVQAFAILSHVAEGELAQSLVNELKSRNQSEYGPMLYAPPFLTERDGIGRESAKKPGTGENGSCYTHGSMMYTAAMLEAGDADEALKTMLQMVPSADEKVCDVRWTSPLWWCNYYQSPYAGHPGRGSNIISSGAPAWFTMNIANRFFGLEAVLDGLKVSPKFPSSWNEAKIERIWRGAKYIVTVKRTGRNSVKLDGKEVANAVLPIPQDNSTHIVEVEIA
ncbi:MAG: hypothetical protein IJW31_08190 [Lentisphaeria bacterium]|nr:hypothetical protein [Lentisphaeria bacterium]